MNPDRERLAKELRALANRVLEDSSVIGFDAVWCHPRVSIEVTRFKGGSSGTFFCVEREPAVSAPRSAAQ